MSRIMDHPVGQCHRRHGRALAPLLAIAFSALLLSAAFAAGDVLVLVDGTRLEGTVRKTDDGYSVTAEDGTVTNVAADKVASIIHRGDNAGRPREDVRLASLRRSVANLDDVALIISKYESFIEQNGGTDAATEAAADLERWRDVQERGLIKYGSEWLTPAERDLRLRDTFLEVSDARMQIKSGDLEKAQQTLARMLKLNPEDVSALYLQGVLELRRNESAKARSHFEKVRAQERSHAPTLVNLAAINFEHDQQQRALTFLAEAMTTEPENRQILDNVAEALELLPEKVGQSRQAEEVRQLFLSQDAALRQQMAERGLYRWGSTWVDRKQLDELEAMEQQIQQKVAELAREHDRLEGEVAGIEQKHELNEQFMRRMENNRTVIRDGKVYELPLPQEYFDIANEQKNLLVQRDALLREMTALEAQAQQERGRFPTPPYKGHLEPIGEDGVPVLLPPQGISGAAPPQGRPGAATAPATRPAPAEGEAPDDAE